MRTKFEPRVSGLRIHDEITRSVFEGEAQIGSRIRVLRTVSLSLCFSVKATVFILRQYDGGMSSTKFFYNHYSLKTHSHIYF